MDFLWFSKKRDDNGRRLDELHKGLKGSFSNIKKDFEHIKGHIEHLHSKKEEHHGRLNKLEEKLILLEEILNEIKENHGKFVRNKRSTIERVQSFNHSESFMNVQIVKNLTPSQKQVILLLLYSQKASDYKTLAEQSGISIVTIRRHINDIKRAGVGIKEKISVKNRTKFFYLDDDLKRDLAEKSDKVRVKSEKNDQKGVVKLPKVRDYIG